MDERMTELLTQIIRFAEQETREAQEWMEEAKNGEKHGENSDHQLEKIVGDKMLFLSSVIHGRTARRI